MRRNEDDMPSRHDDSRKGRARGGLPAALVLLALALPSATAAQGVGCFGHFPDSPFAIPCYEWGLGRDRVRYPDDWGPSPTPDQVAVIEAVLEALTESRRLYETLAPLSDLRAYIVPWVGKRYCNGGISAAQIIEFPAGLGEGERPARTSDPCWLAVFKVSWAGDRDDMKFTVAHEVSHCHVLDNISPVYEIGTLWWQEGSAEYFAANVYPSADTEHSAGLRYRHDRVLIESNVFSRPPGSEEEPEEELGPDGFPLDEDCTGFGEPESLPAEGDEPALELAPIDFLGKASSGVLFLQHYANTNGGTGGVWKFLLRQPDTADPADHFRALAALPGFDEVFHDFGTTFLSGKVEDPGGGYMPSATPTHGEAMQVLSAGEYTFSRAAASLVIAPYHLFLGAGLEAEITVMPGTPSHLKLSARNPPDGAWARWTRGSTVTATTNCDAAAKLEIALTSTVDDPSFFDAILRVNAIARPECEEEDVISPGTVDLPLPPPGDDGEVADEVNGEEDDEVDDDEVDDEEVDDEEVDDDGHDPESQCPEGRAPPSCLVGEWLADVDDQFDQIGRLTLGFGLQPGARREALPTSYDRGTIGPNGAFLQERLTEVEFDGEGLDGTPVRGHLSILQTSEGTLCSTADSTRVLLDAIRVQKSLDSWMELQVDGVWERMDLNPAFSFVPTPRNFSELQYSCSGDRAELEAAVPGFPLRILLRRAD